MRAQAVSLKIWNKNIVENGLTFRGDSLVAVIKERSAQLHEFEATLVLFWFASRYRKGDAEIFPTFLLFLNWSKSDFRLPTKILILCRKLGILFKFVIWIILP